VRYDAATADAGDQGGVGDQAVDRAEDGGAQPAAGDVTVAVYPAGRGGGTGWAAIGVRFRCDLLDFGYAGSSSQPDVEMTTCPVIRESPTASACRLVLGSRS
jgi:hypothetical protein